MWTDGTYDLNNVFAKIVRRELPSAVVYEDEDVLAFMDAFPQQEGHVLVISKTSTARHLLDADTATLRKLIVVVQRIAAAVCTAWRPDGVVIAQLNGPKAGQTVEHLHFHVIPHRAEQPLMAHGQPADPDRLSSLASELAMALPG